MLERLKLLLGFFVDVTLRYPGQQPRIACSPTEWYTLVFQQVVRICELWTFSAFLTFAGGLECKACDSGRGEALSGMHSLEGCLAYKSWEVSSDGFERVKLPLSFFVQHKVLERFLHTSFRGLIFPSISLFQDIILEVLYMGLRSSSFR